MNDRIKLAEALGWHSIRDHGDRDIVGLSAGYQAEDTTRRDPSDYYWKSAQRLPDPFTDANDCEALIKHLNSKLWTVSVFFGLAGNFEVSVVSGNRGEYCHEIQCDDWKQGVCELALKFLNTATDEQVQP